MMAGRAGGSKQISQHRAAAEARHSHGCWPREGIMRNILLSRASLSVLATTAALFAHGARAGEQPPIIGTIETITVEAQRRTENIQSVPISVTAISADQLDKSHIFNNQDLDAMTPGLVTASVQGTSQMYIRGIGS